MGVIRDELDDRFRPLRGRSGWFRRPPKLAIRSVPTVGRAGAVCKPTDAGWEMDKAAVSQSTHHGQVGGTSRERLFSLCLPDIVQTLLSLNCASPIATRIRAGGGGGLAGESDQL